MKNVKTPKFIADIRNSMVKHSPEILMGLGIAGMVTTTVLAVKATPKALKLIEMEKERLTQETDEPVDKLTPIETIKTTWKCYIPAAATCAVSVACLIGSNSVNARRHAALATAYKISETAMAEYRAKVIETLGEKKEKDIMDKVHKERIEKNPATRSEVIITEHGKTLCYDYYTGRYFKSDIDKIKKAVNEVNRRMLLEGYISLNELYEEIGLDTISEGDKIGWKVEKGLLELEFSTQLSDDGTPCLVIDFREPPKYGFDKFF